MTKIIRILSVILSCACCAGMIICTKLDSQTGVYVCMAGCFVGFLGNMLATARENQKTIESNLEQEQTEKI